MKTVEEVKSMIESEEQKIQWGEETIAKLVKETKKAEHMDSIASIVRKAEQAEKNNEIIRERLRALYWVVS